MRNRAPHLLLLTLCLSLAACGTGTGDAAFTVPGEQVFPEGIAVNKANGDLFVGSTDDGAVYRGNTAEPGELELFLEPGQDGREAVTGMKVDEQGRLLIAGRGTGRVFAYDAGSGELIEAFEIPADGDSLLNDLTLTADAAYLTDSFRPVIYRLARDAETVGEPEPWLDLEGTPLVYGEGFNLNGISASDDGRYLLTVQSNSGALWRIDTETAEIAEVDLGGEQLTTGDGALLDGRSLYVVRNDPGVVAHVELSEDYLSGEVVEEIDDPSFDYPTTLAEQDGRLFVVNSQLDRAGDTADLPFTVSDIPFPGATR
jgi:Cu-Zn family superoxide dismutase